MPRLARDRLAVGEGARRAARALRLAGSTCSSAASRPFRWGTSVSRPTCNSAACRWSRSGTSVCRPTCSWAASRWSRAGTASSAARRSACRSSPALLAALVGRARWLMQRLPSQILPCLRHSSAGIVGFTQRAGPRPALCGTRRPGSSGRCSVCRRRLALSRHSLRASGRHSGCTSTPAVLVALVGGAAGRCNARRPGPCVAGGIRQLGCRLDATAVRVTLVTVLAHATAIVVAILVTA